ncbi:MAG: hydroxysqualene dehydroxylase HpnE [Actinomycetota bacterium]|nr:hydroxysqualene dehydroxylase HpnE [Actinomycetota bacterium]
MTPAARARRVLVVGGGLAGLSAAIQCQDAGAEVLLFESRPRFGGATWSFQRKGLQFDNGQHVYLRCCIAYRRFLERLGTADLAPLQDRLAIPVISPSADGPVTAWIRRSSLPAPLHLLPSLLSYRHLTLAERVRLGRAVRAMLACDPGSPELDEETFGSFLRRHGQSDRAIALLFDLIALPTLNVHADEAALGPALKVFRTGLLDEPDGADIGWARVPLARLHVDPAIDILRKGGAIVHDKAKVEAIDVAGARPAARVAGERLEADAIILAVAHEAAAELLPPGGALDPVALRGLGTSPIIDVHLVYDRKVLPYELAAAVHSPAQFVFDRTAAAGLDPADGQCLAISVSGADGEHGERPEELIDRYVAALEALLPAARDARLVDAVVSREHSATFRAVPGTARLRPGPISGLPGLYLAGSWTDTGWPATMEGAVRSGVAAAACALGESAAARGNDRPLEEVLA